MANDTFHDMMWNKSISWLLFTFKKTHVVKLRPCDFQIFFCFHIFSKCISNMCGSSLATIGYPPCCPYSMLSTLQLLSYPTKTNLKDVFNNIKIMRTHDRDEEKVMVSPKKKGCKIKQHLDLLYGSKQRCNVWASGTKHNHWSFPSYFVSVCILWSIIRHSSYAYKSARQNCRNQRSHLAYKNYQRVQASWLQNTHQSSDSYWGLALHMCIIICLAKLLAQRRILTTSQVI